VEMLYLSASLLLGFCDASDQGMHRSWLLGNRNHDALNSNLLEKLIKV
jgi:hypothetical protein